MSTRSDEVCVADDKRRGLVVRLGWRLASPPFLAAASVALVPASERPEGLTATGAMIGSAIVGLHWALLRYFASELGPCPVAGGGGSEPPRRAGLLGGLFRGRGTGGSDDGSSYTDCRTGCLARPALILAAVALALVWAFRRPDPSGAAASSIIGAAIVGLHWAFLRFFIVTSRLVPGGGGGGGPFGHQAGTLGGTASTLPFVFMVRVFVPPLVLAAAALASGATGALVASAMFALHWALLQFFVVRCKPRTAAAVALCKWECCRDTPAGKRPILRRRGGIVVPRSAKRC